MTPRELGELPAYPQHPSATLCTSGGMTIRMQLAMAAMPLAAENVVRAFDLGLKIKTDATLEEIVAALSFSIADAMLSEALKEPRI